MTEAEEIAKFIAEHGVTQCPPAVSPAPGDVKIVPDNPGSKADRFRRRQWWSHGDLGKRTAKGGASPRRRGLDKLRLDFSKNQ